jgi:hypothetical protein
MYKKYNYEPKNLSYVLEKITPFLIIATTFIWLWK